MIPLLLISHYPTYEVPKNHNESSSSFFWVETTLGLQCLECRDTFLYFSLQTIYKVQFHANSLHFNFKQSWKAGLLNEIYSCK